MMWPQLQSVAELAVGWVANSLPEGLLVALFAWGTLRLLPRQNSRTRFAVWFVALLAVAGVSVAGLPLNGGGAGGSTSLVSMQPLITISRRWGVLLFLAWVLAAGAALLRLMAGLWRLRELRRGCTAIDLEQLAPATRGAIAEFSSSRSVTLASSENMSVPAAIGFFKPMIVVPSWALRELSAEELNIILLHEFAHLRRWDDWTNLLQKVVRAVLVFHPAVLWIDSRLALEREMACDDEVLAETANPRGYAQCLISLLEKSCARRGWTMAQAAVNRAREATLRIAQILDARRPQARRVWKPALVMMGALSLVCLVIVPHAPEFVAFERNTPALVRSDFHVAALSHPEFQAAVVIPAALRTGSSPSPRKVPQPPAHAVKPTIEQQAGKHVAESPGAEQTEAEDSVVEHSQVEHSQVEHSNPAPQFVAARWSIGSDGEPGDTVTVRASETMTPEEMVFVVQTAQQVGPNAWVWSVCVWRVRVANPAEHGMGIESKPVAKKT